MTLENFSIYVLGTVEDKELFGDLLFRGSGYKIRKVDGLIVPARLDIDTLKTCLYPSFAYEDLESYAGTLQEEFHVNGRLPLSAEKVHILETLAKKLENDRVSTRHLKKLVGKQKVIEQGFSRSIAQTGYREELLERVKEKGSCVYGCLSQLYINPCLLDYFETNGMIGNFTSRASGKRGTTRWI